MDARDGRIYTEEELKKLRLASEKEVRFLKPMLIPPTPAQMRRVPPRVGRNEPCPCGSGKKFKRCCHANRVGEAIGKVGSCDNKNQVE